MRALPAAGLLALAASAASCSLPGAPPATASLQDPAGAESPPAAEAEGLHSPPPLRLAGGDRGDSFRLGAWGGVTDLSGDLEGAAEEAHASVPRYPAGAWFEWRKVAWSPLLGTWTASGILAEYWQERVDEGSPGGEREASGMVAGLMVPAGLCLDPVEGEAGGIERFRWRVDLLLGFRYGEVHVAVPDGAGGRDSESSGWVEYALGGRAEFAPWRGVTFFVRGDLGTSGSGGGMDSEGSVRQFQAGVRVEPLPHVAVLAGWRGTWLVVDDLDSWWGDYRRVTLAADGPWVGLEVEF